MTILVYLISIISFCLAAFILPLLFMPLVWVYKAITKESVIPPTHPVFLVPFVLSTVILLYLTRYIWLRLGFDPGWLFPLIIGLLHFLFGSAPRANRANQAQAYGVVVGVLVYGALRLFSI